MQFHKEIFYFNPKMGHVLDLAILDKLNRAGFVVAPYNTPEEVPSVKSVSGPARHVGEADKRVRDSRGGSPCGENRCGIGECREGEGTRGSTSFPLGPQGRFLIFYFPSGRPSFQQPPWRNGGASEDRTTWTVVIVQ